MMCCTLSSASTTVLALDSVQHFTILPNNLGSSSGKIFGKIQDKLKKNIQAPTLEQ
jgi:hypothetical protein